MSSTSTHGRNGRPRGEGVGVGTTEGPTLDLRPWREVPKSFVVLKVGLEP